MLIKNGKVFCAEGNFKNVDLELSDGVISAIDLEVDSDKKEMFDAKDCYVIPGLMDIHIHGAMGADFSDGSVEAIGEISTYLLSQGVTSFLGTTMALPEENLRQICETAEPYIGRRIEGQANLAGINLEGPFFNQGKRGAQNPEHIIAADFAMFSRLYEASGNGIRTVAVAPEISGGLDFVRQASKISNVSLAHSAADYEVATEAFHCGANHVTHLFNGMAPFNHRNPGIVGASMDAGAYVEVISDGIHLHPSVVRAAFKLYGDDHVCLISDSMRACGLTDGAYDLGGQKVTVKGATARIESGSIAGSVTVLMDCFRKAVAFGIPLESVVKAATINPAKSVGLEREIGSIEVGKRADILILDDQLNLRAVIANGKVMTKE
ncbi:MAG: N-acetylglucosamine-6-phosphate deacetylase [Lachnospiraceae bacterium]|nr:N-acetylglucosamine-6-phosphate deacetylase [Lachnospiraceae bacterium]